MTCSSIALSLQAKLFGKPKCLFSGSKSEVEAWLLEQRDRFVDFEVGFRELEEFGADSTIVVLAAPMGINSFSLALKSEYDMLPDSKQPDFVVSFSNLFGQDQSEGDDWRSISKSLKAGGSKIHRKASQVSVIGDLALRNLSLSATITGTSFHTVLINELGSLYRAQANRDAEFDALLCDHKQALTALEMATAAADAFDAKLKLVLNSLGRVVQFGKTVVHHTEVAEVLNALGDSTEAVEFNIVPSLEVHELNLRKRQVDRMVEAMRFLTTADELSLAGLLSSLYSTERPVEEILREYFNPTQDAEPEVEGDPSATGVPNDTPAGEVAPNNDAI